MKLDTAAADDCHKNCPIRNGIDEADLVLLVVFPSFRLNSASYSCDPSIYCRGKTTSLKRS